MNVADVERVAKLTERQRDCLRLVAQLRKTEQIAAELQIAPSTVKTHIERAVMVLGAVNRREAARMVVAFDAARPEKAPTPIPPLHAVPSEAQVAEVVPTSARSPRNGLGVLARLGLAMALLALLCLGFAGLAAAIGQLSDWRTSLAPGSEEE